MHYLRSELLLKVFSWRLTVEVFVFIRQQQQSESEALSPELNVRICDSIIIKHYCRMLKKSECHNSSSNLSASLNSLPPSFDFVPLCDASPELKEIFESGSFGTTFSQVGAGDDMVFKKMFKKKKHLRNEVAIRSLLSSHNRIAQVIGQGHGPPPFLILEPIHETLKERLDRWRDKVRSDSGGLFQKPNDPDTTFEERIKDIAIGIVKAMRYIESQGVVLNSLQPQTIGFDWNGKIKLLDFSKATVVRFHVEPNIKGLNLRYVAPEHLMGNESGLAADVYSFGIMLWELSTLGIAFPFIDRFDYKNKTWKERIIKMIAIDKKRPTILRSKIPSRRVRNLIEHCWDGNPYARPSFVRIWFVLREVIYKSGLENPDCTFKSKSGKPAEIWGLS